MTPLTPVRALWLRFVARRLARSTARLLHEGTVADPMGSDPELLRKVQQVAHGYANATALDGALTAYLEQAQ